ncbi:hypothetical protein [Microvirga sp. 2TAF3]|uniref:hypothetical protein n=1 Tax=Microvirga sp. 2TAF3 TaxID=3233014 RepID=UPI003F9E7B50
MLFLSTDPETIDTQIAGADLSQGQAGPLRDDISTDEITPLPSLVYFDERLASHPYTGFKAGDRLPIGVDAVKQGGFFAVTVGGKRYGKGSSREHSPVAEKAAGIRLVIAESFERIYRQNADNVGLLRYGEERLSAVSTMQALSDRQRPRTLFEKILARHVVKTADSPGDLTPGIRGFVRADIRFIHDIYTGMCSYMLHGTFGKPVRLYEPESIIVFEDHYSYAHLCAPEPCAH